MNTQNLNEKVNGEIAKSAKKATKKIKNEILKDVANEIIPDAVLITPEHIQNKYADGQKDAYIAPEFQATPEEKTEILELDALSKIKELTKETPKPKKEKVIVGEKAPRKKTGIICDLVSFLSPVLSEGNKTKKEIVEIAVQQFPDANVVTIQTILTDCKNVKYNKFPKLVVVNEKGFMEFVK